MDEREQESWHLNGEIERGWRRKTKRCERLTSMRTIIGERKPYDRKDVRSRDCHATDAHVSYGKLSKGTSGGASDAREGSVSFLVGYPKWKVRCSTTAI